MISLINVCTAVTIRFTLNNNNVSLSKQRFKYKYAGLKFEMLHVKNVSLYLNSFEQML